MAEKKILITDKEWEDFGRMCQLQCTEVEFCDWFGISEDTLNRRCKEYFGMTFADTFKLKRGKGLTSLRRKQWKLADKNAAMAIFLGKNYLGQSDKQEVDLGGDVNDLFSTMADIMGQTHDKESDGRPAE